MSEAASTTENTNESSEFTFKAEVNQVLDIVVHSLYSHREIFLRELISNASDALDKLRFKAVTDHDALGEDTELGIQILCDKEARTLTIRDNGCGMTRDELIENLGTIAHSGTRRFKEAMSQEAEGGGADLIGRFGVGFYSSYLVADRVDVVSRAVGEPEAHCWSSAADGSFTVEPVDGEVSRGTSLTLHLKEGETDYLEEYQIRQLVKQYSDYVGHPIELQVEREETEGEGEEATTTQVVQFERINEGGALWKRPRNEITSEQYSEFYKHLTHDFEEPLAQDHFTIEGTQLFTGLIFIPKARPFDMFDREQSHGLRLYVKRVFIMDECDKLLPEWLRFVRGIVDSDDLPLNVSRELVQEHKIVGSIRKNVTKKVLDVLEAMATDRPDDYKVFWENFGVVLKEGLHYDQSLSSRLAELVRFQSSMSESTSLALYVERMVEGQKAIYYVTGPSKKAVQGGAHMEALQKKGYEVLFMTDPVDEFALQGLTEYDGKKLQSAMQADLGLDEEQSDDEKKEQEARSVELEDLVVRIQSDLDETVSEVRLSQRLTDSPCCLVTPEGGLSAHVERMLRAQNANMPAAKRIFEINGDHPVIEQLRLLQSGGDQDEKLGEWVALLHDQALLAEGSPIPDPQGFSRRLTHLMTEKSADSQE